MKKNIIIIVLFSLALFSCSGLLDVNPVDAISDEIAIKDRSGVEKALTGSYNSLQSIGLYGRYQVIVGDLAADNLIWTGTTQDFGQMLIKPIPSDNSLIESMWTGAYDGINRVNNILDKLPGISGMAEKDQFMGEALFLRSLLYFNLANYFGNVPLRLKPTLDLSNIDMAATSQQLIIKQCTEDLRTASKLMSATQVSGHANKYSAEALLAKVYLADFHLTNNKTSADSSVAVANRVINTGRNILFEVVFDIQNYNRLAQYFFSRSYAGRYEIAPSEGLINSYEPLDNRKNASIALDDKNKPYCIKYKDVSGGADNVAVIRSEDIYLTRAEALAYSNGNITTIKSDINFIRNKAGLANTSADNYNDLKIAVENERRHEFAFEGHRWVDLVRTKRATTVLGIDQKNTLFPIPLFELQTNKLLK